RLFASHCQQFTFRRRENTAAYFQQTRKKMPLQPLLESTCCTNSHRLLQRIVVLETKLLAGLPKQAELSADRRHGPPQHTAGESRQPIESQQFISVEEQAETDRHTNRWHKQGARPKGTQDIRLSRVSRIAAVASSTPDMAMTRLAKTGILPPPIQLENRLEALMNVGEESPNVIEHGSYEPAANIAANRRSMSNRQRHSAQSAAELRTLIVATVSDVNRELQNILMKHKTAYRIIIHVGKNDIEKEQSELLKKDFSELIETLRRLEVQPFISGPLPARGTNMFSRLLGLNACLQRTCSLKGVNFIDNLNLFLNIRSLKNKCFLINDLITTYNLDFMFLTETWLEDNCSATVLNETAPPNFTFMSVCRAVRR
ncbi:hypothetical protein M9458_053206, partial [Cirrhinus mrigala]